MERVIPYTRYNYYKYYVSRKEQYKMNYLEKRRREQEAEKYNDYLKDYWILSLWKDENMREYHKNKINSNNSNET
tara:strand:- start:172 stop:396 length:225 start_codon:yes stop_codon:yes gene_type:complete